MKRLFIITFIVLVVSIQVAFASFDYYSLKESLTDDDYFTIDEVSDTGNSFIESDFFSISERSFSHKNESLDYYSYFVNDWLILDYAKIEAKPLRRLWLYLSSKTALNIASITFSFNDTVCTFSNFFHPMIDITKYDNGDSLQSICLVMGEDSIDFHTALLQYIYSSDNTSYDSIMNLEKIKMVLHGTEDIEIELPNSFIMDFIFTDMIFPEVDYNNVIKMAVAPTTFNIKSSAESQSSYVLPLGANGEFAIKANGSYIYNTPLSDLSGYETTDKWMFEHDENVVCIVHGYTNSATIYYFYTDDNSNLSSWKLIVRCIESVFSENANFFNDLINYKRDGAKLVFTAVDDLGTGKVYYAYTFVILKNGIICVSSNTTNDDNAIPFVEEIVDCIMAKSENGFIQ